MSKVVCDDSRCIGCLTCVTACLDRHYTPEEAQATPLRRYEKRTLPSDLRQYFTFSCRHCAGMPCAEVCPAGAIVREAGRTVVEREKCLGCRKCLSACPFHVPAFDTDGKMVKCDLCAPEAPACVAACPRGALKFVAD